MGHYDNGEHGSNAPGDVEMARALPAGSLAMIVGDPGGETGLHGGRKQKTGRLRAGYAMQTRSTNGIWIVQAHEWGKYVGRADC